MINLSDTDSQPNLEKPPILYFSSSDWDGKWGSRQQVARILAGQGYPVLFIEKFSGLEHFYKYQDQRQRRQARWREGIIEKEPNLWLLAPPALLPGRYYSTAVAKINADFVYRRIKTRAEAFLQGRRPLLWLFKPEHHPLVGRFNERLAIYHCIDEYTVGTAGRKRDTIIALEKLLLNKADLVFANSKLTFENKSKDARAILRVPSGANTAHFAQALSANPHPELSDIQGPILIFSGSINDKIDTALLLTLADRFPTANLLLLGPILAEANADDIRALKERPNVMFKGKRPFDELPQWFAGADLCLLPYVDGEATRFRSPLKLYEYLATGLPVISTPHPEVNELKHVVSIVPAATWPTDIEKRIELDKKVGQVERLREAEKHDWETRVADMLAKMEAVINRRE